MLLSSKICWEECKKLSKHDIFTHFPAPVVAQFFAFFPADFQAKERLPAVYQQKCVLYSAVLLTKVTFLLKSRLQRLISKMHFNFVPRNNALTCGGCQNSASLWNSHPCMSQMASGSPANIPSYTASLALDR